MVKKLALICSFLLLLLSNTAFAEEEASGKDAVMIVIFVIVGIMLLLGVIVLAYMWTKPEENQEAVNQQPPTPLVNNFNNNSFQNQTFDRTIKVNSTMSKKEERGATALTFVSMTGEGKAVTKIRDYLEIGRGEACNVVLSDNTISSRHARITLSGNTMYIEDCNSSNGTLVNGRLINEKTQIKSGDMVIFGKAEYQLIF